MSERVDKQRYLEAKSIATAAIERDPADRADYITSRCGDDSALLSEVDWLSAAAEDDADDEVPESFQVAARDALREVSLEVPLPRNYRLIRRISQGGTGIVYLAERVDGDLRQPVAFKLLHFNNSEDPELQRRFAAERRILSPLSHPAIAHLVDRGLTADGRRGRAFDIGPCSDPAVARPGTERSRTTSLGAGPTRGTKSERPPRNRFSCPTLLRMASMWTPSSASSAWLRPPDRKPVYCRVRACPSPLK